MDNELISRISEILEQFSEEKPDEEKMLARLRGKGAFRRFKDTVFYLGIREDWFAYRDERLREIAQRWCRENGVL